MADWILSRWWHKAFFVFACGWLASWFGLLLGSAWLVMVYLLGLDYYSLAASIGFFGLWLLTEGLLVWYWIGRVSK